MRPTLAAHSPSSLPAGPARRTPRGPTTVERRRAPARLRRRPSVLAGLRYAVLGRLAALWTWRRPRRAAAKLLDFALTEAGSALDMLRAAELEPDPRLARRFFRHGLDEARHAALFRRLAFAVDPAARATPYAHLHAERQDLYQRLGREGFLAFVHLAEAEGEAHFRALAAELTRLDARAVGGLAARELGRAFGQVAREERGHRAYARVELLRAARRPALRLAQAQLRAGGRAWRRAGRQLGDRALTLLLWTLYAVTLWPFAALERRRPRPSGWVERAEERFDLDFFRRSF